MPELPAGAVERPEADVMDQPGLLQQAGVAGHVENGRRQQPGPAGIERLSVGIFVEQRFELCRRAVVSC